MRAPGGVPVFASGAGTAYGASRDEPVRLAPPGWLRRGRTSLAIAISGGRPPVNRRVVLRCGPGATPSHACRALLAQRAALLAPPASDTTCRGGPAPQVEVSGTVAGIPIRRTYSNCYGGVSARWLRLLR